ncbi:F-box/WD repeat-containing protein 5-like protein, partial [Leptotrombidium deliense]
WLHDNYYLYARLAGSRINELAANIRAKNCNDDTESLWLYSQNCGQLSSVDLIQNVKLSAYNCLIFCFSRNIVTPHEINIIEYDLDCFLKKKTNNLLHIRENYHSNPIIDVGGQITGTKVLPKHKLLYVNVRPWADENNFREYYVPDTLDKIITRVIDINKCEILQNIVFEGHRAIVSQSINCFRIYVDANIEYVVSGSEDNYAYIWNRISGKLLAKLPHSNVVSCGTFIGSKLITCSDDHTIKVWNTLCKRK